MKKICFLDSPGIGCIDIWLPFAWHLKTISSKYLLTLQICNLNSISTWDEKSKFFKYSAEIFNNVCIDINGTEKGTYAFDDLMSAKRATTVPYYTQIALELFEKSITTLLFFMPNKLINRVRNIVSIKPKLNLVLKKVRKDGEFFENCQYDIIFCDLTACYKPHFFNFLYHQNSAIIVSMLHGSGPCWLDPSFPYNEAINVGNQKIIVCHNSKEAQSYKLWDPMATIIVSGTIKHDPRWITYICSNRSSNQEFVLLIDRPESKFLARHQKKAFLQHLIGLCKRNNLQLAVKGHPKQIKSLFDITFWSLGILDFARKRWRYTNDYPLSLIKSSKMVVCFYSGLSVDAAFFDRPSLELLNPGGLGYITNFQVDDRYEMMYSAANLIINCQNLEELEFEFNRIKENKYKNSSNSIHAYNSLYEDPTNALDVLYRKLSKTIQLG